MAEDTEVTGPLVLNLWVSSTSEDMDIFATIRNIDPTARTCARSASTAQPVPCVTKGWLRASHRKLDPEKSLPYRPYHAHDERWWLEPGRARRMPGRDLADVDGVQERPQAAPRHPAARRRRQRAVHALPRRLQRGRGEHDLFGRGQAVVAAGPDDSLEVTSDPSDVIPAPGGDPGKNAGRHPACRGHSDKRNHPHPTLPHEGEGDTRLARE